MQGVKKAEGPNSSPVPVADFEAHAISAAIQAVIGRAAANNGIINVSSEAAVLSRRFGLAKADVAELIVHEACRVQVALELDDT